MAERSEQLRETLRNLHEQLAAAGPIDSQVRDELNGAVADIQSALRRSGEAGATGHSAGDSPSVVQRVSGAAQHFENSHPVLYDTLVKLGDLLAKLGI